MNWSGLNIFSNLPRELLIKAMDLLQADPDSFAKLVEWQTTELPKQMKEWKEKIK